MWPAPRGGGHPPPPPPAPPPWRLLPLPPLLPLIRAPGECFLQCPPLRRSPPPRRCLHLNSSQQFMAAIPVRAVPRLPTPPPAGSIDRTTSATFPLTSGTGWLPNGSPGIALRSRGSVSVYFCLSACQPACPSPSDCETSGCYCLDLGSMWVIIFA